MNLKNKDILTLKKLRQTRPDLAHKISREIQRRKTKFKALAKALVSK